MFLVAPGYLTNYFIKIIPSELRPLATKLLNGKSHDQPTLLILRIKKKSLALDINHAALRHYPLTNKYITTGPHAINKEEILSSLKNHHQLPSTNKTAKFTKETIQETTQKLPRRNPHTERLFGTPSKEHLNKLINLRDKADHIFTELINAAIEHGNPIPIDSTSASTNRINQRLLFLSIQLSKIDRESVGDIPKIIQIQTTNEHKPPYKIIYNTKYNKLLDDYPNTKNALIKGNYSPP